MSAREAVVNLVRRVDRKIFRRSVALLHRLGDMRGELDEARAEIEDLRATILEYSASVEAERRETRAQFVVIRSALEPTNRPESDTES